MQKTFTAVAGFMAVLLLVGLAARAQGDGGEGTGAKAYEQGNALLAKGDLEGALEAFAAAAKAPEAKPEYRTKFLRVRAVLKMQNAIAGERDLDKWWKMAVRLRNFYYNLRLYEKLLGLAREMHERKPSASTATLVADALLILDRNAEAEKTLAQVEPSKLSQQGRVLLGVAKARQKDKADEAKAILAGLALTENLSPRFLLDVARLKVLCGDIDGGMATLTTAFEKTNPKGIAGFRSFAKSAPDFARVPAARFLKVLETESKVTASSCSGGSSCGSCPKRGGCASRKENEKK